MWPVLIRTLRVYAPYVTLPFAAIVGFIGYNFESLISDRYTPYNAPVKEERSERLMKEDVLTKATEKKNMEYNNVLNKNLSPSLQN